MNDDHFELRRRLASATPVTDSQVAALDLRDAETELLEEIMATTTDTSGTPEVDLHSRPPEVDRRHVGFRLAVAAAAVAVLGTAAVVGLGGDNGKGVSDAPVGAAGRPDGQWGPGELPRLVPTDVPAGLELTDVYDSGQASEHDYVAYFGHEVDGELPVVDLAISWSNANEESTLGPPSGWGQVGVRDGDGYSCSGSLCEQTLGSNVAGGLRWTESPGKSFDLASPSMTVEQLVAIAEGLTITDQPNPDPTFPPERLVLIDDVQLGSVPADLPVRLDELDRHDYRGPLTVTEVQGDPEDQPDLPPDFYHFTYRPPSEEEVDEALMVEIEPASPAVVAGALAVEGPGEAIEVRGKPGWALTLPAGPAGWDIERTALVWQETPASMVRIETWGVDLGTDDLVEVAESLTTVTDAEYDEMAAVSDDWPNEDWPSPTGD
jgi:hypothetical protein